ncbi:short chain dehydrogenase reductase family oxidoreductase [Fusarium globosum]|uniref:Short chain dehydrogenase reductase family oxidoreductase n=1 Tax=Fusarium globosum TaxID=78864 RepID=A0A8H5XMJ1_9HYPO|nr:short chain dehydrogenase reductase family oxidoreductase [Fusarium globosum]
MRPTAAADNASLKRDWSRPGLEKLEADIHASYPETDLLLLVLDVTSEDSVTTVVAKAVDRFGRIDIAIHSAGVGDIMKPTHKVTMQDWRRITEVNQTAFFEPRLIITDSSGPSSTRGIIVNVASSLGLKPPISTMPSPTYSASKHAVIGLTKSDAKFYAAHGIRINAVCPGWVRTPMTQSGLDSGLFSEDISMSPMGRAAEVHEVAEPILFLVSASSSFICGVTLCVDGGYSL